MSKNVVLIGASRGLGKAMAHSFAHQPDVRHLVLAGRYPETLRTVAKEIQRVQPQVSVHTVTADARSATDLHLLGDIASQIAPIDVWVNNAGYNGGYDRLARRSTDAVAQCINTTLLGAALGSLEAVRRRVPVIANVAGGGSAGEATPTFAVYGASKAGVKALTEALALEEPDLAIALIWPGIFASDLLFDGMGEPARFVFERIAANPVTVADDIVPELMKLHHYPGPARLHNLTRSKALCARLGAHILSLFNGARH